jgi:hypothetical protein
MGRFRLATTRRSGLVPFGISTILTINSQALAEVPVPPKRPMLPAIVFFPGSGTSAVDTPGQGEGPVLTIYDSQSCDAKIAGECALVTFTCDDQQGRGLGIAVDAIETPEVVKWLEAGGEDPKGMEIEVKGLAAQDHPTIGEITKNDFGGGWRVTFYAPYSSDPGLTIVGDQLVVKAMPRTVSLELTQANRSALEQFIQLCARE